MTLLVNRARFALPALLLAASALPALANALVFPCTKSIVIYTAPTNGVYHIEAYGAKGGNSSNPGGFGVKIGGDFSLAAGEIIQIATGCRGASGLSGRSGGGGGGTFVVMGLPLLIAGGGGGAGLSEDGQNAQTGTAGGGTGGGATGSGGAAGVSGNFGAQGSGGGGGGFNSDGGDATDINHGNGGKAFRNGLAGGSPGLDAGTGGFGGGGGGGAAGGGGGGGYSGGGGGNAATISDGGAGGGSYNAGANPTTGLNPSADGCVVIVPPSYPCTGSIATYTVPGTGIYHIEAYGAKGGSYNGQSFVDGGAGAKIAGDFSLTAGQTLKVAAGCRGGAARYVNGAGGGGSFVVLDGNTPSPLLIAGGGGGTGGGTVGGNGQTGPPGQGIGGAAGAGELLAGGGGGGFLSNGNDASGGGRGGRSWGNGLAGGAGDDSVGGFGGGGGSSAYGGGGGGGYTGGPGGNGTSVGPPYNGGGGTSYFGSSSSNQITGTNPAIDGDGTVSITAGITLSVSKQHVGTFTQGGTGEWDITVSNAGPFDATSGTTTVVDTLPTGYTVSSFAGTDASWSCSGTGTQTATCNSVAAIGVGASFPVIKITVNIPTTSPVSVTNTASAYGGGDPVHPDSATAVTSSDQVSVGQVPAGVSVSAGSGQSTAVGSAFTTPLTARVVDAAGLVVQGVTVNFSAPGSGASATFSNNGVATTNANGLASVTATANLVAGGYSVAASINSGAVVTSPGFSLTNTAGARANVAVFGGNGQSTTVATAFATELQAKVTDSYGNPVNGVTVTFTAPGSGASATLSNNGVATTNSSGIAVVTATANNTAGAYSVAASINSGTVVTTPGFSLTNTAGAPANVAVFGGNGQSTTVATAFATALQAKVTDSFGNPVNGATVTFTAPGSGASATLSNSGVATTNSSGIAAVTATANNTAGGYSVTASINSGSVVTSPGFSLTNTAGAPANVAVFGGNGQSTTVATAFATELQAKVTDSYGNPVNGVTVTFTAPGSGASATLSNNGVATTNSSGIAAVTATANNTSGGYSVAASINSGTVVTTPGFSLTNTAGAPANVAAFAGSGQSTTVATAFATQLQAKVTDANGNPVSAVTVTFAAPGSGASATFSNNGVATTNSSGLAFVTATANNVVGGYSVTASINSGAVATSPGFSLTNTAGAGSAIAVSGGGTQSTTVGMAFATQLQAKVTDANGNPVSGAVVNFAAPGSGASATLSNNGVATTNSSGIASVTATANTIAGGTYTVTASISSGAVRTSPGFSLTNTAGTAFTISKTAGDGGSALPNQPFVPNLKVTVVDQYGNPVPNKPVTFTVQPGPAGSSATFASSPAQPIITGPDGTAVAPVLTANAIPGTFSVVAVDQPPPLTTTFTLTITPVPQAARDAESPFQVRYLANLNVADAFVNITNVGTVSGNDPAGRICANLYVFDPNEEPVSCCACPVTPNGLVSLSAKNSLLANPLTPANPSSVVVNIVYTAINGDRCDAGAPPTGSPLPGDFPTNPSILGLACGGHAWAVTSHAYMRAGQTNPAEYQLSETPFANAELSPSEYVKLVRICNFIQSYGSGYGLCKGCSTGARGGQALP